MFLCEDVRLIFLCVDVTLMFLCVDVILILNNKIRNGGPWY